VKVLANIYIEDPIRVFQAAKLLEENSCTEIFLAAPEGHRERIIESLFNGAL
jgi:hypothetical protein